MHKSITYAALFAIMGTVVSMLPAQASVNLLRSPLDGAVYFVDSAGVRHTFPNLATYQSWYGSDTTKVITLSVEALSKYPLGRNITMRPGTKLVKITTNPNVYAVTPGGILRALPDEETAELLFGKKWASRVIDVPDVFFSDYPVGLPIEDKDDLPDGHLILKNDEYFYLERNILQRFASVDAVRANGFNPSDAVTTSRSYYVRSRPVTSLDPSIFNPVLSTITDTADCSNAQLKVAFVIVGPSPIPSEAITPVEQIKQQLSSTWAWASNGLSKIDTSYPTILLPDDSALLNRLGDGTVEIQNEVLNTFFESHPDQFDFVVLWSTLKTPSENNGEIAHFVPVTNLIQGINRSTIRAGEIYGSGGKLKGVISMGEIGKYHPETANGMAQAMTYLHHEVLHQWGAYLAFANPDGSLNSSLLRAPDKKHWSYYGGWLSPLGGSGWRDNGDGTFTSQLSEYPDGTLRPFSTLDLYAMGLIPKQLLQPVFYVEPKTPGALGNTIAGTAKWVSVDQLIAGSGGYICTR